MRSVYPVKEERLDLMDKRVKPVLMGIMGLRVKRENLRELVIEEFPEIQEYQDLMVAKEKMEYREGMAQKVR